MGFRIGTSLGALRISSSFSRIAWNSVPYRIFRMGTLSCSEGKGHTFDCRVRHFTPECAAGALSHAVIPSSDARARPGGWIPHEQARGVDRAHVPPIRRLSTDVARLSMSGRRLAEQAI